MIDLSQDWLHFCRLWCRKYFQLIASSIVMSFGWFMCFLLTKYFPTIALELGRGFGFALFSAFSLLSFFFVFIQLPNMDGKNFQEIQEMLTGKMKKSKRDGRFPENYIAFYAKKGCDKFNYYILLTLVIFNKTIGRRTKLCTLILSNRDCIFFPSLFCYPIGQIEWFFPAYGCRIRENVAEWCRTGRKLEDFWLHIVTESI